MFKKFLTTTVIFAGCLSTAFASGSFYLGPALTYTDYQSHDLHYVGLNPGIQAGYGGWARDWLYFAAELFATTGSITIGNDKESASLKTDYNYGISFIPMINLDDVLFGYLRLGYIQTKFKSASDVKGAYQIGVGLEGNLTECWYLRGEYVYTPYTSVDSVGSVRSNQVTASLIYRFESLLG